MKYKFEHLGELFDVTNMVFKNNNIVSVEVDNGDCFDINSGVLLLPINDKKYMVISNGKYVSFKLWDILRVDSMTYSLKKCGQMMIIE